MSETAARQCDRVLPAAPSRQWVLSLPWELRLPVARDPALGHAGLERARLVVLLMNDPQAAAAMC
jgi:hypothetical protein